MTTVVSVRTDGQIVRGFALPASISDDGQLVAFVGRFADVVPGRMNSCCRVSVPQQRHALGFHCAGVDQ
jgi:hypothetical protein